VRQQAEAHHGHARRQLKRVTQGGGSGVQQPVRLVQPRQRLGEGRGLGSGSSCTAAPSLARTVGPGVDGVNQERCRNVDRCFHTHPAVP